LAYGLWLTAFGHCDVCLFLVYGLWLLWCLSFFGLRPLVYGFCSLWYLSFFIMAKSVTQRKANITMAKSRKPKNDKHHHGQKP
jgi:hypothetical protein